MFRGNILYTYVVCIVTGANQFPLGLKVLFYTIDIALLDIFVGTYVKYLCTRKHENNVC